MFAAFTDLSLDNYQSYDKALDIYYLTVAYLSVLRNWRNPFAVGVAAFLWYYRLVGVLLFELTDVRWLLMVFPNTFEYFFIAIEVVRTRWDAPRLSKAAFLWTAGLIWVVIKLPQEWWIHVAQLDFTDEFRRSWSTSIRGSGPCWRSSRWSWSSSGDAWSGACRPRTGRSRWTRTSSPSAWAGSRGVRSPSRRAASGISREGRLAGLVTPSCSSRTRRRRGGCPWWCSSSRGRCSCTRRWRCGEARRGSLGVEVAVNTVISVVAMLVFAAFATGQRGQVSAGDVLLFAYVVALIVTLYDRYSARREACELGTPSSSIGSSSVARTPSRRATRGPVLP